MPRILRRTRLRPIARVASGLGLASLVASLLYACAEDAPPDEAFGADAAADAPSKDGARPRGEDARPGPDPEDASVDATDATDATTPKRDADGPGAAGDDCELNRDCRSTLRCECVDYVCQCRSGARGAGKNGVDVCTSENDCESAFCVDGPGEDMLCSDECATDADCAPALPRCIAIGGLSFKFCARKPPP